MFEARIGHRRDRHHPDAGRNCDGKLRSQRAACIRCLVRSRVSSGMPGPEDGEGVRPAHERAPTVTHILIADDDVDSGESCAMALRLEGFECTFTDDAETAMRLFEELKPDAVLLDIAMPGCSGLELARRMRASSGAANVLLIAITGWADEADERRSHEAGFDHHMVKPIDFDLIIERLRRSQSQR
jgi:CheY-like chemotaxis protein